jgi:hypothetical protein
MAGAKQGHALFIQPPERIDLASFDELDRLKDFGRGYTIGRPAFVGWSPWRRPPLFPKGVGCLGRLGVGHVMLGDEPASCQASGHSC